MARQVTSRVLELTRSGLVVQTTVAAAWHNLNPRCLLSQTTRPYSCRFQQVQHLRRQGFQLENVTRLKMQCAASLHCGSRRTAIAPRNAPGVNNSEVITFIKDDQDLRRFLNDIFNLLSTPAFSKIKMPIADAEAKLEELVRRLIDVRADPRNIFAFLQANPKVLTIKWDTLLMSLQYLNELGLFGNRALLTLDRDPKLWNISLEELKERVGKLRKLGLIEGSLQRVITTWPGILTMRNKRLNGSIAMLKKCQFSNHQITTIIVSSPQVLDIDPSDIEHRFQYVYFTMGLRKQDDMVQANLFRYPLEHVRRRHILLERLGVYELPNKRGNTCIDNPKFGRIIDCTDARFAEKCARISLEEFQVFARTFEEEERGEGAGSTEEETEDAFGDFDDATHR